MLAHSSNAAGASLTAPRVAGRRRRQQLRARFPDKLWLDVLSKADLLEEELDAADAMYAAGTRRLVDWEHSQASPTRLGRRWTSRSACCFHVA